MNTAFTIFFLMMGCIIASAQNDADETYEQFLLTEESQDEGASMENILQLLSHPVNLNTATKEDLQMLPYLSPMHIDNIMAYRKKEGNFISVYELQAVEGMDVELIRKIKPMIDVKPPSEVIDRNLFRRIKREGETYAAVLMVTPIQRKAGFSAEDEMQRFNGSPYRMLVRLRSYQPGDFSFGITAEKDEGERLEWNKQYRKAGFDHLSFHAQLVNKGRLRNLIVGDYQCQFGQGLVWGGASGFQKGSETVVAIRKANVGLVPYTSAYESGYFRGAGATVSVSKDIFATVLLSRARRDGNVRGEEDDPEISAVSTTGLHRSENEMTIRKAITERVFGGALSWRKSNAEAGLTFQNISFDATMIPRPQPYNQFVFRGRSNTNMGMYVNYNWQSFAFFSEFAMSASHGHAFISGVLAPLSKRLEFSFAYRNYAKDFHPFFNNGLSENTLAQNERGIYWGWKYKISRRFSMNAYADMFEFPWLKFRTYAPSGGSELLVRVMWQPSRTTLVYLQARQETKRRNKSEDEDPSYALGKTTKYNYWLNVEYPLTRTCRLRTRLQASQFRFSGKITAGLLLFQDVAATFGKLKVTARYAMFDTDDFDNRLYAYENDVWLSYSLPAYYGKGTRQYLMVQYKLNRAFTFWVRFGHTRYIGVSSIGSGLDKIEGNVKNDLKFETRIRF